MKHARLSHAEMLTRRDFIAVATSLGQIEDATRRREEVERWIGVFRASNPRFDSSRFVAYVDSVVSKRTRTRRAAEQWMTRARKRWPRASRVVG